jgi:LAO/AO transport system kinase
VETVGVGQSEVAVADLVDLFVLVAAPGGGDELQGIKRGIMELADVIVVNKADGDLRNAAQRAAGDLRTAMHLMRPKRADWEVAVLLASSLEGVGVPEAWTCLTEGLERLRASGALDEQRAEQAVAWMWSEVREEAVARALSDPSVAGRVEELQREVREGRRAPASAAAELLGD